MSPSSERNILSAFWIVAPAAIRDEMFGRTAVAHSKNFESHLRQAAETMLQMDRLRLHARGIRISSQLGLKLGEVFMGQKKPERQQHFRILMKVLGIKSNTVISREERQTPWHMVGSFLSLGHFPIPVTNQADGPAIRDAKTVKLEYHWIEWAACLVNEILNTSEQRKGPLPAEYVEYSAFALSAFLIRFPSVLVASRNKAGITPKLDTVYRAIATEPYVELTDEIRMLSDKLLSELATATGERHIDIDLATEAAVPKHVTQYLFSASLRRSTNSKCHEDVCRISKEIGEKLGIFS